MSKFYTKKGFIIPAILIVLFIIGIGSNSSTAPSNTSANNSNSPSIYNSPEVKSEEPKTKVPTEYLSALAKAKTYSTIINMSRLVAY